VDQVVERVLLGEEVLQLRIARAARAMQEADVAARAEGAEGSFLARAADGHGQHLLVLLPGQQDGQQIAHHAQRQRIQRLGPVQGDHAHAAPHSLRTSPAAPVISCSLLLCMPCPGSPGR
jgi:site-specific recombinase XerC